MITVASGPAAGALFRDLLGSAQRESAACFPHHEILHHLNRVFRNAQNEDLVLIYCSGLAIENRAGRLHLSCADTAYEALESTSVPVEGVASFLEVSDCRKAILLLDCWYSAAADPGSLPLRVQQELGRISDRYGMIVVAASTNSPPGMLADQLADGMRGGEITLAELRDTVRSRALAGRVREPDWFVPEADWQMIIANPNAAPAAVPSFRLMQTLECPEGGAQCIAFSPGGRRLACGGADGSVRVWGTDGGACEKLLQGHRGAVYAVCYCAGGGVLASAGVDRTIVLWDACAGTAMRSLAGHAGAVLSLSEQPGLPVLASAGRDGVIRLWDIDGGVAVREWNCGQGILHSVVFSPDGSRIASGGGNGTLRLWDTSSGALPQTIPAHRNTVHSIRFSPDGGALLSASRDARVKDWRTSDGSLRQVFREHRHSVLCLDISPDGRLLASGSAGGEVRFWDLSTGCPAGSVDHGRFAVHGVQFSPDGNLLASAAAAAPIRIWQRVKRRRSPRFLEPVN